MLAYGECLRLRADFRASYFRERRRLHCSMPVGVSYGHAPRLRHAGIRRHDMVFISASMACCG